MKYTLSDVDELHKHPIMSKGYREHKVFAVLKEIYECYDSISFSSFNFPSEGIKPSITNIDSYIYSSIGGTIDSIGLLLEKVRINDVFALLRKYFDEILFDIYQTAFRHDEINKHSRELLYIVPELQKWLTDKVRTPRIETLLNYIKGSATFKELYPYFDFKVHYKNMRIYLDDNIHLNSFIHLLKNDNNGVDRHRVKYLDRIYSYAIDLFTLHFASILYLHPYYCISSDYFDAMDLGLTPEKGSENWVANWAQTTFKKYIAPHKDLAEFIKRSSFLELA